MNPKPDLVSPKKVYFSRLAAPTLEFMQPRIQQPVIKVSEENKNRLMELKEKLNRKSVDDVITVLLAAYNGVERARGGEGRVRAGPAVEEEPVPDRFSCNGFARKLKVREYFCGLPENGFTWLYQQLRPQVCWVLASAVSLLGLFFVFVLQMRSSCPGDAICVSL